MVVCMLWTVRLWYMAFTTMQNKISGLYSQGLSSLWPCSFPDCLMCLLVCRRCWTIKQGKCGLSVGSLKSMRHKNNDPDEFQFHWSEKGTCCFLNLNVTYLLSFTSLPAKIGRPYISSQDGESAGRFSQKHDMMSLVWQNTYFSLSPGSCKAKRVWRLIFTHVNIHLGNFINISRSLTSFISEMVLCAETESPFCNKYSSLNFRITIMTE